MFGTHWRGRKEEGGGVEGTGGREGFNEALIFSRKNVSLQLRSSNCQKWHVYLRPRKHTRAKWRMRHTKLRSEMAIIRRGRVGDARANLQH